MKKSLIGSVQGFHWLDLTDPTSDELEVVAKEYNLPAILVRDCLQPEHLPKFEIWGDLSFLIVRTYDERCSKDADEVRELTRKVAVFFSPRFIVTIHRSEQTFLERLRSRWQDLGRTLDSDRGQDLLMELLKETALSYRAPVQELTETLENLELALFQVNRSGKTLEEGYYLRRRTAVFRRMLRLMLEVQSKVPVKTDAQAATSQDVREAIENLLFYIDGIYENVTHFLNLHISFAAQHTNEASHRTNEVMRILTLFSVFFLPLNFLASIYGMNFEKMPELKSAYGYPGVLLAMTLIATFILTWFKRKKWL